MRTTGGRKPLATGHQDILTDMEYDTYGFRMATCSADHSIKVFDRVGDKWVVNDSWRAHDAPVVKISWSLPQFFQILASGSHDCTVKIWEEVLDKPTVSGKHWRRRFTISDFGGPLYDVAFSPSRFALRLAAIAGDGILRVYEALDPNNIGYWTLVSETMLLNHPVTRQLQSSFTLAWAPSAGYTAGGDDPSDENEYLVVCVLEGATIFRRNNDGKYIRIAELPQHRGLIRDVAWAPTMGRSYDLIATACKDGYVRVFEIRLPNIERDIISNNDAKNLDPGMSELPAIQLVHESPDHGGEVWKVSWNITGTVLASSGDDAKVRFWKRMHTGPFKSVAVKDAESPTA